VEAKLYVAEAEIELSPAPIYNSGQRGGEALQIRRRAKVLSSAILELWAAWRPCVKVKLFLAGAEMNL
jgi:hypothetical protein